MAKTNNPKPTTSPKPRTVPVREGTKAVPIAPKPVVKK